MNKNSFSWFFFMAIVILVAYVLCTNGSESSKRSYESIQERINGTHE